VTGQPAKAGEDVIVVTIATLVESIASIGIGVEAAGFLRRRLCRTRRTQGCRLVPARSTQKRWRTHSHIPIAHLIQATGVDRTERVAERRQAQRLKSPRNLGPVF
jgi:hypothetical protein